MIIPDTASATATLSPVVLGERVGVRGMVHGNVIGAVLLRLLESGVIESIVPFSCSKCHGQALVKMCHHGRTPNPIVAPLSGCAGFGGHSTQGVARGLGCYGPSGRPLTTAL
jgi:hypothetical protein